MASVYEEYFDTLSEEDLAAIEEALSLNTTISLRLGLEVSDSQANAVERLDKIIDGAPTLEEPMTAYKAIPLPEAAIKDGKQVDGKSILAQGGTLTDAAFFSATSKKPSGDYVVTLPLPKGSKALVFPGGDAVVLPRNTKVQLPAKNIAASGEPAVRFYNGTLDALTQFHLPGQHDQSTHSRGGGGGGSRRSPSGEQTPAAQRPPQSQRPPGNNRPPQRPKTPKWQENLRKVRDIIGLPAAVIGLGIAGFTLVEKIDNAKKRAKSKADLPENKLSKGDKAVLDYLRS